MQRGMRPEAVVLVGLPGSGKSTLAERMQARHGGTICSQDAEGGDRVACEQRAWETLEQGNRAIIDRTNITVQQRALWISLAKAACQSSAQAVQVAAIVFDVPVDDCVERARTRTSHPTLSEAEVGPAVRRCADDFEEVSGTEGFSCVLRCKHVRCLSSGDAQHNPGTVVEILHGESDSAEALRSEVQDALEVAFDACKEAESAVRVSEHSGRNDTNAEKEHAIQQHPSRVLGSVVAKMQCVYTTEFRGGASVLSANKGENAASQFVRPEAREMFESGHFLATVKVHGRCCKWENGQCFRRLDLDLGSGVTDEDGDTTQENHRRLAGRAPRGQRISRREHMMCEAFLAAASQCLGVELTRCWQAGEVRGWSWFGAVCKNWGWVCSVCAKGWKPSAPPDRHGHWIGYVPVRHLCEVSGRVLPVDHDADVRHGFDEARGVAFCLAWPEQKANNEDERGGQGGGTGAGDNISDGADNNGGRRAEAARLVVREVPMSEMEDGSYELVGPSDAQGGPYRRSLPDPREDAAYNAVRKFPSWEGDRNHRCYFVRHGSVQWVPAAEGGNPPPSAVDQTSLRRWMQSAGVEGVVWHGTGPFAGRMFKCHVGHLGIAGARAFAFRRGEHRFVGSERGGAVEHLDLHPPRQHGAGSAAGGESTAASSGSSVSPSDAARRSPTLSPRASKGEQDAHRPASSERVRLRVCRGADRKDVRVILVERSAAAVAKAVRNKWRQAKVARMVVEDGRGARKVSEEVLRGLRDGALVVAE